MILKISSLFFSILQLVSTQQVTVQTPMGSVTGFHVNYNENRTDLFYGEADIFLGIPYVQPPIGNLRFQVPQPLVSYPNGRLNASTYKPACPQIDHPTCSEQSEDCLYLNVYSPNATTDNKFPVMVWIHGGSLSSGCTKFYPYQGAVRNLVSRGVVVVVIQYRLGLPGFYTTNTPEFPANRGMLDQVEALKWVQRNIASFGGDPNLVTLFGQSAGGISISAHTYSPLSRGLFHQAIMESGAVFTQLEGVMGYQNLSASRAYQLCNVSIDQLSNGNFSDLQSCMSSLTPAEWTSLEHDNPYGWRMVVDNNFMPSFPQALNSERAKIPVIYGNMHDEWAAYWYGLMSKVSFDDFNRSMITHYLNQITASYGNQQALITNLTINAYIPPGTPDNDSATWWLDGNNLFTGLVFTEWIIKDINLQLANGNPNVYLYEQTYGSRVWQSNISDYVTQRLNGYRPVAHSAELPFIWVRQTVWDREIQGNRTVPFDFTLIDDYGIWWTNFAKFGKPTIDDSWKPVVGPNQLQHFRIDEPEKRGMMMVNGYRDQDRNFFLNNSSSY